jgi:hypothetical protein
MVSRSNAKDIPDVVHQDDKSKVGQVERVVRAEDERVDYVNYDCINSEVAKYAEATTEAFHISEEKDRRLKRMIDRRTLPVMVITYLLQVLDKGTLSFTSIMDIRNDIPILLHNSNVHLTCSMVVSNIN